MDKSCLHAMDPKVTLSDGNIAREKNHQKPPHGFAVLAPSGQPPFEHTLDPLTTKTHVTSTPKFVRKSLDITKKMSTRQAQNHPLCGVSLISSCMIPKVWVDHVTEARTNHKHHGQLLLTSPCAHPRCLKDCCAPADHPKPITQQTLETCFGYGCDHSAKKVCIAGFQYVTVRFSPPDSTILVPFPPPGVVFVELISQSFQNIH